MPCVAQDHPPALLGGVPLAGLRVVTGRLDGWPADQVDELRRHTEAGGSLLVMPEPGDRVQQQLTGVCVVDEQPRGEWFVTLCDRPEAVRLEREVPVTTSLRLLAYTDGAEVVATSSVRFRHAPTLVHRRLGAGRVVVAGVADVPSLLAHPTLGRFVGRLLRAEPMPASRELGVAVVGYGPFGGMGYLHGLACTETDGLRLVAVVDSADDRLTAALGDFPDLRTYDSVAALAADDAVDVAIVATPPSYHAELAIELARAGKHVVVEKPMCLTVADADRMIATARAHDRVLTVHQSRRWDPDFLALQRAVSSGLVGDVFNIETFVGGFEHPCRAWHSEASVSGGAVYDWGSHHVDWILTMYGTKPSRVVTSSHKRVWHDVSNADQLTVWLQWPDGREATFRQSDVAAVRRPKFYVQGTAATLEGHYRPLRFEGLEPGRGYVGRTAHHAEAPVDLRLVRYEAGYGLVEQHLPPAPTPAWGFHRNLADHLLLAEPLAVPPEQSRDVVRVLEAAHRAGESGSALVDLE